MTQRGDIFHEVERELARGRLRSSGYFAAAFITAIVVLFVLLIIAGSFWSLQHVQWDLQWENAQSEMPQFDTQWEAEQNDGGA